MTDLTLAAPDEATPEDGGLHGLAERQLHEALATLTDGAGTNGSLATDGEPSLAEAGGPEIAPAPPSILPLLKGFVSGTFRSTGSIVVELRVDVDMAGALNRVSADYFTVSGGTETYFGSMRCDSVAITRTATTITARGVGAYTWAAGAPKIEVKITRPSLFANPTTATLRHLTLADTPGATYSCSFKMRSFRTVRLEQDRQDTVTAPFSSYDTASLPSGIPAPGPFPVLSVPSAYTRAGIALQSTGGMGVVPTAGAGANARWSDAELHAAMQSRFSLWRDVPQWAVWLFHAFEHDLGPGLLGIMFDQQGHQRQGCAVFYRGAGGTSATQRRLQLYTCVHELGHCFNLLHSWQKSLASPPGTDRPASPSWMNYPWKYTGGAGGEAAFWSDFAFRFDAGELAHLRHAFRKQVIMGGNNFAQGSGLVNEQAFDDPVRDRSGLEVRLSASPTFAFGAPVAVDVSVRSLTPDIDLAGQRIKPSYGLLSVAVRRPNGELALFEPLLERCWTAAKSDGTRVDELQDTAFIHFGRDGFIFDAPGRYQVRARYGGPDGSVAVSNVLSLRVAAPRTAQDAEAAELMLGDEQGILLSLVGSDNPQLAAGNEAFSELRERFPEHPLAAVASIVQATNAAREFKLVRPDNSVEVRSAAPDEASRILADARIPSDATGGVGPTESVLAMTHERRPDAAPEVQAYIRSRRREVSIELGADQ